MCGIGGIRSLRNGAPIPHGVLDVLSAGIAWRGPHGSGRHQTPASAAGGPAQAAGLVHRRLSVIDHAGGAQPMTVEAVGRRVTIAFNGCVYNHKELREHAAARGVAFRSDHADSEALAATLLLDGTEGLNRVEGMFALAAVWDDGTLLLARDRFGEKPLYLAEQPGWLVFASSVPPLLRARDLTGEPESKAGLDPEALARWIWLGFDGDRTPYQGVRQLQPGSWLRIEPAGALSQGVLQALPARRPADPAGEVEAALDEAVRCRLDADVPVVTFLSGGIDSALVTAAASRAHPNARALTVRMPHADFDESAAAAETARHLGVRHDIIDAAAQPIDEALPGLISTLGLPFADSSLLPTHALCRAAASLGDGSAAVALSGDGADELFYGYDRYDSRLHVLLRLGALAAPLERFSHRLGARSPRAARVHRAALAAVGRRYLDVLAVTPTPMLAQLLPGCIPPGSEAICTPERARGFDLGSTLPGDYLRKVDTASMAVGLEVRAPFLASRVAAAALATPRPTHTAGGPKSLLRAIAASRLPRGVTQRRKQGFAIPVGSWLRSPRHPLRTMLLDTLSSADPFPRLTTSGVELRVSTIQTWIAEHDAAGGVGDARPYDHAQRLYQMCVLGLWARGG